MDTCPRCRLALVRFLSEVKLPRFTMRPGDTWEPSEVRFGPDGSLRLGGGIAPSASFEVVNPFNSRAIGCDHKAGRS